MHAKPLFKVLDVISHCREACFFCNGAYLLIGSQKQPLGFFHPYVAQEILEAESCCLFNDMGQVVY